MVSYVLANAEGRIYEWGHCSETVISFVTAVPSGEVVQSVGTPDRNHVVDGAVIERPVIAAADIIRAINEDWVLPEVPDGTEVTIAGTLAGTTTGGLTLAFPAAGLWTVKLDPPWPWIGVEVTVEVTP